MSANRTPVLLMTTPASILEQNVKGAIQTYQFTVKALQSISLHLDTVEGCQWHQQLLYLKKKVATANGILTGKVDVPYPFDMDLQRKLVSDGLMTDITVDFRAMVEQWNVPAPLRVEIPSYIHESAEWFMNEDIPKIIQETIERANAAKDALMLLFALPEHCTPDYRTKRHQLMMQKAITTCDADLANLKKKLLHWI
jgi:hypothetical protein